MQNEKKTRVCNKCGIEKIFNEFAKATNCKFGIRKTCNACRKEYRKNLAITNKDKIEEVVENAKSIRKICKKCGENKSLDSYQCKWESNGIYSGKCKKCLKIERIERRIKIKLKVTDEYLHSNYRVCSKCKKSKQLINFPKCFDRNFGVSNICKDCDHIRGKKRYKKEKITISSKAKIRRRENKTEIMNAYGGKCACCGATEIEFLSIEHGFNNGAEHKRKIKDATVYRDLKKRGFPKDEGIECLCMNCNFSKGKYGYCPHEKQNKQILVNTINSIIENKLNPPKTNTQLIDEVNRILDGLKFNIDIPPEKSYEGPYIIDPFIMQDDYLVPISFPKTQKFPFEK